MTTLAVVLCCAAPAWATAVRVSLHGSKIIFLESDVSQLSVADDKIADVKLLGNRQLLVNGKRLGHTLVSVWARAGAPPKRFRVHVELPLARLRDKLQRIFPKQKVSLETVGNAVVVGGQVADAVTADRVKQMVQAYLEGMGLDAANVMNFLTVRGQQQVQLRVKVAEVSRTHLRQIGGNYWLRGSDYAGGELSPGGKLDSTTAPDLGQGGEGLQMGGALTQTAGASATSAPPMPLIAPPFSSDAFSLFSAIKLGGSHFLSVALNILQREGLAKVLSEPTLVAFSGQKAKFLAGGEFPVPIPQGFGQTGIEYKKFGVQLDFTPTVLGDDTINLNVSVVVSDKDTSGAVLISGTSVPALATRHTETTVRLKNGQSFAIAGLFQDKMQNSNAKVPLLGDIPLLGILFRRSEARRQETELVVLATVNLVQPLKPNEVPSLPGEDEYSDPGSLPFFLMGTIDAAEPRSVRRGPAGPVGFSK